MVNDQKSSELLSKSLHGMLNASEQDELQQSMDGNKEAEAFAKLSHLIQDSVASIASASLAGDPTIAPGLSADAKERLRESIREAKQQSIGGTVSAPPLDVDASHKQHQPTAISPGDVRQAGGRFTMLRRIGEGGLGTVWLARDEDLKRVVAIKEMHPETAESPKHIQRFHREAAITGLLEHPNVVPLYMFGVSLNTGKPFYAMRFLGKQTLSDAIAEYHARLEAGQAETINLYRLLTVFLDICQAIAYAHSRGVIHRDLKPENVALDSFGQVIVLDWGVAKLLSDGELAIQSSLTPGFVDDSVLTETLAGEVVGTPLYMAPEQAAGDMDSVDQRTDVYGLGAILFAILAGVAPHEKSSADVGSSNMRELLQAIAKRDPPAPRLFNPTISRDLEAICMRAMSRQRYIRHATAQELADDVERWMAGQHEKRKHYDAMRMEGRDMRSNLNASIRDFGTNVRFMSMLPPIQGLIDSAVGQAQKDAAIWRERLSTIFIGLLRANTDFVAVSYSRVVDGQHQELVRVERPSAGGSIRSVPKSRLASGTLDDFGEAVMRQKPDDVHIVVRCLADGHTTSPMPGVPLRIEAGAVVFDREEEPFGMVAIEGDFGRLVRSQVQTRGRTSDQALVIDHHRDIVLLQDCDDGQCGVGRPAIELLPSWPEIKAGLTGTCDYVDGAREVCASCIELVPGQSALALVLTAKSD